MSWAESQSRKDKVMKKVVIVGASGTGKSTLAKEVSKRTGLPRQDLDDLYWNPGWEAKPVEEFRAGVEKILEQDSWIIEGVQDEVRNDILNEADTLIWIDPPALTHYSQLARRTFNRLVTGKEICNGNQESLYNHFCTTNSIFLWAYSTRKHFNETLKPVFKAANDNEPLPSPVYETIENFVHLTSRKQTEEFLNTLSTSEGPSANSRLSPCPPAS